VIEGYDKAFVQVALSILCAEAWIATIVCHCQCGLHGVAISDFEDYNGFQNVLVPPPMVRKRLLPTQARGKEGHRVSEGLRWELPEVVYLPLDPDLYLHNHLRN
jgi:hypothetical protein